MKYFVVLFAIFFQLGAASAQQSTFSKVLFNSDEYVQCNSASLIYDGGYVIAGDNLQYSGEGIILKVDSLGEVEWNTIVSKTQNNTYFDITFSQVVATYDSLLFVFGDIYYQSIEKSKGIFLKVSKNGDIIWTRTIEWENSFHLNNAIQTSDSGFIVTGYSSSYESSGLVEKVIVFKLNKMGNFCWFKKFDSGNNYNYHGYTVKQVDDTNYYVSGYSYGPDGQSFIMKISSNGSLIWAKRYYKNSTYEYCYIVDFVINNIGLVLYAKIRDVPALIQTDSLGNIQWVKLYSGINAGGLIVQKLHKTSDQGMVLVMGGDVDDGFILKTDSVGNPLFADELIVKPKDVFETVNNEYFVIGNGPLYLIAGRNITGEIGLIQLDSMGNGEDCIWDRTSGIVNDTILEEPLNLIAGGDIITISSEFIDVRSVDIYSRDGCIDIVGSVDGGADDEPGTKVYPNPSPGGITVLLNDGIKGFFIVYDIYGHVVVKQKLLVPKTNIQLNHLIPGTYLYRCTNMKNENISSGKLVIN